MDVTASKHAWVWVPTEVLFQSLQSLDMSENRGYLLVSEK
ncbi:MAG: hypothetical protein KDD40_05145, partial [Bdellovibrionales bacterium]|nr:hypothetical protein [Bdellovibrionales bacterium]